MQFVLFSFCQNSDLLKSIGKTRRQIFPLVFLRVFDLNVNKIFAKDVKTSLEFYFQIRIFPGQSLEAKTKWGKPGKKRGFFVNLSRVSAFSGKTSEPKPRVSRKSGPLPLITTPVLSHQP